MTEHVHQMVEQSPDTQVPMIGQPVTFAEAGTLAARSAMTHLGLPGARSWFEANAPDADDQTEVQQSGRPLEFWQGMFTELMSVAGTA